MPISQQAVADGKSPRTGIKIKDFWTGASHEQIRQKCRSENVCLKLKMRAMSKHSLIKRWKRQDYAGPGKQGYQYLGSVAHPKSTAATAATTTTTTHAH